MRPVVPNGKLVGIIPHMLRTKTQSEEFKVSQTTCDYSSLHLHLPCGTCQCLGIPPCQRVAIAGDYVTNKAPSRPSK